MPVHMRYYALAASQFGGIDPDNTKAVEDYFAVTFPALQPAARRKILEYLLSHEAAPAPTETAQADVVISTPIPAPIPEVTARRGTVVGMNAKQRFPDLIKTIARVRGTSPELLTGELEQVSKNIKTDVFAVLDDVNVYVMQQGLTTATAIAALQLYAPTLPTGNLDVVVFVYNYLFHGGALR